MPCLHTWREHMLQLIEYITKRARSTRVGQNSLDAGSTVWLIEHMDTGRVFSYCYLDRGDAAKVVQRIHDNWKLRDVHSNFISDRERALHIGKMDWSLEPPIDDR